MFNLIKQFLLINKRRSMMTIMILSLSIATILSLTTATESIKNQLWGKSIEKYGEHIAIVETTEVIDYKNTEIGEYGVIGLINHDDFHLTATIGWMDEKAIEIGHIKWLEGEPPKNEHEVFAEHFYTTLFQPSWKVGEIKQFYINGKIKTLKLSGIVDNYSHNWSTFINVEKGVNNFPNIFVKSNEQNKENTFSLVKIDQSVRGLREQANNMTQDLYSSFSNENLLYLGLIDYDNIEIISTLFQFIILCFVFSCLFINFNYRGESTIEQLGILKAQGLTNKNLIKYELIKSSILYIASLIIAIPLIFINHTIIIKQTYQFGITTLSGAVIVKCIVWLLFIYMLNNILTYSLTKKQSNNSVINLLRGKNINKRQHRITSEEKSIYFDHIFHQIVNRRQEFTLIVLFFCFAIIMVFISLFLQKASAGIWKLDSGYSVSTYGYTSEIINDHIVVVNQNELFNYDMVNALDELEGINSIEKQPFSEDLNLLLEPAQYKTFLNLGLIKNFETWQSKSKQVDRNISTEQAVPLNNITYHFISDDEYNRLSESNDNEKSGFILVLDEENSSYSQLEGEQFVFSRIEKGEKNTYELFEWLYTLDKIIASSKQSLDYIETDYLNEEIIVIMPINKAYHNGMVNGYNYFSIILKEDIALMEHETIELKINQIVGTLSQVILQDHDKFQFEDTSIARMTGFLGKFTFIIISMYSAICIFSILMNRFMIEKESWGIYMVNGMKKKTVYLLFISEIIIAYVIAVLMAIFVFTLIMLSGFYTHYNLIEYISDLTFGVVGTLLFIMIAILFLIKKVSGYTIGFLLKNKE